MIMPLNTLRKYIERINSMLPSSESVEAALSQMGWSKHDGVYIKMEWSTLAVVGYVGLEYNPGDNTISLYHGEPSAKYPCICPISSKMIKNSQRELFRLKRAVGD